jgi:cyanophycin synthetase
MEFEKIVALRGPNIWAKSPVIEAWVELGDLKDSPSNEMPGFNDRLMAWLPEMIEHRCSVGERGGFFERLRQGTYLAHIMEHVTLELQNRAGTELGYGRARETSKEGLFRVAFRYEDEAVGRACVETARQLCLAAVYDRPFDVREEIRRLRKLADDVRLGQSTRAVVNAARARGIPVRRLTEGSLVQLGHGAKQHRIHRSATDRSGAVAESISDDKELTKAYLRSAGVPVARGRLVTSPEDAWQAAQDLGGRVVVKPRDSNFGNGVVIGISRREQIEAAYRVAITLGTGVIVEQMAQGAEHRLLVVGGRFVAAARGTPAVVVGDGRQTVAELIESQLNSDPRRGMDFLCPLAPIEFDANVTLVLQQEGYTGASVPEAGKQVVIQRSGNLSEDVTDLIHPRVARHAELAARVIGLDVAGIDVIADDISRPLEEQGGVIIEVNGGPGLQMHVDPANGQPRPVGEAIVATLFAEDEDGRIPLVAVAGRENTAEATRLVAHILSHVGKCVAVASSDGVFVGRTCIARGDSRDAESAGSVLLNPLVEAAVFETSLDRMLDEGLGFDRCLVAVLTEIGEGVQLDLAEWDSPAKRSLAHRCASDVVLPRGAVVMRAGEPLAEVVTENCAGSVILFAADPSEPALQAHRESGGRAVVARQGNVVLAEGPRETLVAPMHGHASPEAVLAAVAAAWAAGITGAEISAALQTAVG